MNENKETKTPIKAAFHISYSLSYSYGYTKVDTSIATLPIAIMNPIANESWLLGNHL
jgi:hypothetical protein